MWQINEEIWKDIPEFPKYQVSNLGRVGSLKYINKFKVLKPRAHPTGYQYVTLMRNHERIDKRIHRLVMLAFVYDSPLQVDHINGIKVDNRLANLRYCTQLENVNFNNHVRYRIIRPIKFCKEVCFSVNIFSVFG